jgi:hypothetical protein
MEYQVGQELGMEMKYPIQQQSDMEQEEGEEPVDDDEESDIQRHKVIGNPGLLSRVIF